ncbi:MAG: hypothetical protein KAR42_10150 [candidate division Zixibacteria bacterium]|nr:hypothetical protein [candidate division Zixibacteria bacterium]
MSKRNKPLILGIDFSQSEISQLCDSGYNAIRGATGILETDNNQFCIPVSLEQVDILFVRLYNGISANNNDRIKSDDSVINSLCLNQLTQEVIKNNGFVVIFAEPNVCQEDFMFVGISDIGVSYYNGQNFPPVKITNANGLLGQSIPIPSFQGQEIEFNNFIGIDVILERFRSSAEWLVLSSTLQSSVYGIPRGEDGIKPFWIARSTHHDPYFLALFLRKFIKYRDKIITTQGEIPHSPLYSGVLVLPSFGKNSINVAISLIGDSLKRCNPEVFPNIHDWLIDFKPQNVQNFYTQIGNIEKKAKSDINALRLQAKNLHEEFKWLDLLLSSSGDDLIDAICSAMDFLGINTIKVDETLKDDTRKREDLHIRRQDVLIAIGEVKSTRRGASEKFISQLKGYQIKYAKENECAPPKGILFVNHSIELAPDSRFPFYASDDVIMELKDSCILAIDTVILHNLCQDILKEKITLKEAQSKIQDSVGVFSIN